MFSGDENTHKTSIFQAFQVFMGAQNTLKHLDPLTPQPLTAALGEVLCHMPNDTQDMSHGATVHVLLPGKPTANSEALQIPAEQSPHLGHALLRQSCQSQWKLRELEERVGFYMDLEASAGIPAAGLTVGRKTGISAAKRQPVEGH